MRRRLTKVPPTWEDIWQRFFLPGKTAGRGSFYLERQMAEVSFYLGRQLTEVPLSPEKTADRGFFHLGRRLTEVNLTWEDDCRRFFYLGRWLTAVPPTWKTAYRGSALMGRQLTEVPLTWEDSWQRFLLPGKTADRSSGRQNPPLQLQNWCLVKDVSSHLIYAKKELLLLHFSVGYLFVDSF